MTHSARKSAKKIQTATRKKPGPAVAALHLLSDAEMRRIAEKIFKLSDADETESEIGVVTDALTRFANNTIHQNVAEQVLNVSVRTVYDGRTARATTNKTDEESLRRVVAISKALARSRPRNPDLRRAADRPFLLDLFAFCVINPLTNAQFCLRVVALAIRRICRAYGA